MKKCNCVMNKYLQQSQKVSFDIKLHTFFCKNCRKQISSFDKTLQQLQQTTSFHTNLNFRKQIMTQVEKIPFHQVKAPIFVSLSKWIIAGSILILSMFAMSYNETLLWTNWSRHFQITLYILMGGVTSAYIAFFTAVHMEEIKKYTGY